MGAIKSFVNLFHNHKTISSASTAELMLDSTTRTDVFIIKSFASNTDDVFVGKITVDDTNGFILGPGETMSLELNNADINIYVYSNTSGMKISFIGGLY